MLAIFIDQDFNHDILRALIRRMPKLDFVTAFGAGLSEVEDPRLL